MLTKTNDFYKVYQKNQNEQNLFGLCFSESNQNAIELIEFEQQGEKIKISGDKVLWKF